MAQTMLRDYLQETEDAISSNRIDDAFAKCQYILTHFPEALEAQRLLGEVYLRQERLDDAQHAFDWVLTNDPEHVIAYCDRALVSERKSDLDTALDCYQQAYELSRGNSNIRHEFNTLSQRVGQQGFMLSRAGLARLYMRGDLLTQAMQEWETVLSISPDRLDARTGLLETLWRDGLYERAEQLATQILQDVPGCLKALLLLAHIVSTHNMPQAQELLQRAIVLDPDLVMAQELFSDLMTKRPTDPFLGLLKKSPTHLESTQGQVADAPTSVMTNPFSNAPIADAPTFVINNPFSSSSNGFDPTTLSETYDRPTSETQVPSWGGSGVWSSNIASQQPSQEAEASLWPGSGIFRADSLPRQEIPDLPTASPKEVSPASSGDPFGLNAQHPPLQGQFEQWQSIPPADLSAPQPPKESELWDRLDKLSTDLGGVDIWDNKKEDHPAESSSNLWGDAAQEGDMPAPPAWLNMLTQGERRQLSGSLTPTPPPTPSTWEPEPVLPLSDASFSPSLAAETGFGSQPSWQSLLNAPEEQPAFDWQDQLQPDAAEAHSNQPSWQDELQSSRSTFASQPNWQDELKPSQEKSAFSSQSNWQEELKPASEKSAFASQPNWQDELKPTSEKSAFSSQPNWQEELNTPSENEATQDEEESSFFGPEWLKSLGAATMGDDEESAEPAPQAPPAVPSPARQASAYESQPQPQAVHESPPEQPYELHEELSAKTAQKMELGLHMTLEELEQSLMAQGFLPLAPNTLSSIAQTQQGASASADHTEQTAPAASSVWEGTQAEQVPPFVASGAPLDWEIALANATPPAPESQQGPTLSSALAELGHFVPSPTPQVTPPTVPATPILPAAQEDAHWTQSFHAPESQSATGPQKTPVWNDAPLRSEQHWEVAPQPLAQNVAPSSPTFGSSPAAMASATVPPSARPEPLLENELETTMRRPAVRLQALQQQRSTLSRDHVAPPPQRGRTPERTTAQGRPTDSGNVSAQGRLVKGYHDQLAGNYDDAMKEYRIIIKSSPELLDEIVSNVRALLRLAPNYAAGYRVLGDAHMRQGEYLQAMEAYNKALTMAKKARS